MSAKYFSAEWEHLHHHFALVLTRVTFIREQDEESAY